MKIDNINVSETLERATQLLNSEKGLSPALKATFEMLLLLVRILLNRLGLNSRNSSNPPSTDKKRERGSNKKKSDKKAGGQTGHVGTRLNKSNNPDEIEFIKVDKRTLPGGNYHETGYESRQVVDIKISRIITEYRAQILESEDGRRYVASFPAHVTKDIQYGPRFKSHSAYMSQFQLLPYERIKDYFGEQMNTPVSRGSVFNFNKEAYKLLARFDDIAKRVLTGSPLLHSDETGINVDKKTIWLHSASNNLWTYFFPHEKRGREAMDAIGILPTFKGILCHDHWKPYFTYSCTHSLCNAHHLRELECAEKQENQQWASKMKALLLEINQQVNESELKKLPEEASSKYRETYRAILAEGSKECPPPNRADSPPKRGRVKKSKSRNLLERLSEFEDTVLRFMDVAIVPFTNNQGENDLRMTKVQQKISGCFRSIEGALIFCRVRSYLSTCRKHGVKITDALDLLFQGKMPEFINELTI